MWSEGLPFSNADIGLLWLLNDLYIQGYKPDQTSFLSPMWVFYWRTENRSLCLFDWLNWMLNKKNRLPPLKIVKPTQSGFTVNDKSSWDVILEKGKTPVSLKMNKRTVPAWFFLCILGYFLSVVWHKSHNFASCTYVSGHWVVLWLLVA